MKIIVLFAVSMLVCLGLAARHLPMGQMPSVLSVAKGEEVAPAIAAEELEHLLENPRLSQHSRNARIAGLKQRKFSAGAAEVALSALREGPPENMAALFDLLWQSTYKAPSLAETWKIIRHPSEHYDRWIIAVNLWAKADIPRTSDEWGEVVGALRAGIASLWAESAATRKTFLRSLKNGGFAEGIILYPSPELLAFLVGQLEAEALELAEMANSYIGKLLGWAAGSAERSLVNNALAEVPTDAIPALGRVAQRGKEELAANARALLKRISQSEKPEALGWEQWAGHLAAENNLLRSALARAEDADRNEQEREFAVHQALYLSINVGKEEFVRCAERLLSLARDGEESVRFRVSVLVRRVVGFATRADAPVVIEKARQLLLEWAEGPNSGIAPLERAYAGRSSDGFGRRTDKRHLAVYPQ